MAREIVRNQGLENRQERIPFTSRGVVYPPMGFDIKGEVDKPITPIQKAASYVLDRIGGILFTAVSTGRSGKKDIRVVNAREGKKEHHSINDFETLSLLQAASTKHNFSLHDALTDEKGIPRTRNETIAWLRIRGLISREEAARMFAKSGIPLTTSRIRDIEKQEARRKVGQSGSQRKKAEQDKGSFQDTSNKKTDKKPEINWQEKIDAIGQEKIDRILKKSRTNSSYWGGGRYLRSSKVLEELGIATKHPDLKAKCFRYLRERYNVPSSKVEIMFIGKFGRDVDFNTWFGEMNFQKIKSLRRIAKIIGVDFKSLRTYLIRKGIPFNPQVEQNQPVTEDALNRMRELAEKWHISLDNVVTDENGIPLGRNEVIVRLRQNGLSERMIGEIFGSKQHGALSRQRIHQIEKRAGKLLGHTMNIEEIKWRKKADDLGQEIIDQLIKEIPSNKSYWTSRGRLKAKPILEKLGLETRNKYKNYRRWNYIREKYNVPKSKIEIILLARFGRDTDWSVELGKMSSTESIPDIAKEMNVTWQMLYEYFLKHDIPHLGRGNRKEKRTKRQ